MSISGGADKFKSSQPRDFAEPPAEIRRVIEAVASHVARHGAQAEFRLRSGPTGRREFPFLYLDNQYAPYYQVRLREARDRRSFVSVSSTPERSAVIDQVEFNKHTHPVFTNTAENARRNLSTRPAHLQQSSHDTTALASVYQTTPPPHHSLRKITSLDKETTSSLSESVHDHESCAEQNPVQHTEIIHTLPNSQPAPVALNSPPPTPQDTSSRHETIPYGLLQEVHLLDNNGTELSGLATFLVISNAHTDDQPTEPLNHQIYNSPTPVVDTEPVYRLRPDTSVIFRAPHSRILPVGFALGAEVKQHDNVFAAVVVRRTVERGVRLYDVKDELGELHLGVPENMLEPHEGGVFEFRLPH